MKNTSLKQTLRTAMFTGAAVTVFAGTTWVLQAQQGAAAPAAPQVQQEGSTAPAAPAQGRGRGRGGPALPTPRLADGTVNLGRVPGEKGIWNVPYITNMAMRVVGPDGQLIPEIQQANAAAAAARAGGAGARGGGGGGGGRGGTKSEPWIPFQPWAAALYDYNSRNDSKYDPEGYCLPGWPAHVGDPVPSRDHPTARAEAHRHDLRGRCACLA